MISTLGWLMYFHHKSTCGKAVSAQGAQLKSSLALCRIKPYEAEVVCNTEEVRVE